MPATLERSVTLVKAASVSWRLFLGRDLAMCGHRQLGKWRRQSGQHTLTFTTVKTDNKVARPSSLYFLRILHQIIIWGKSDIERSFTCKVSHIEAIQGSRNAILLISWLLPHLQIWSHAFCSWILDVQLPRYGTINLKNSESMIHNWVFIQHLKTLFSLKEIFLNGSKSWL